ncbi:hypothetical protein MKW92_025433 [Papaver armeniacum]|nr:hypothetical protein MKW92_025433 [Papaver armeniacum]
MQMTGRMSTEGAMTGGHSLRMYGSTFVYTSHLCLYLNLKSHDFVIFFNGYRIMTSILVTSRIHDKHYGGCLSLKELSQRIRSESGDDFRREQAALLESFLDHLIKVQQEQRFVANSFSVHMEQLRKSALSSNVVDDDGDRHKCPLILSKHTLDYYIWRQKHLFDSLCTMSRESVWLLKTLKYSYFSSPSTVKESNKILDMILAYISKFKKSKVSFLFA